MLLEIYRSCQRGKDFEKANQGIVFEGAKEKLLDIAYDTFKDPDQDGIALSLEKLGLI